MKSGTDHSYTYIFVGYLIDYAKSYYTAHTGERYINNYLISVNLKHMDFSEYTTQR